MVIIMMWAPRTPEEAAVAALMPRRGTVGVPNRLRSDLQSLDRPSYPVCLQAALRALRVSASAAPTTRAQLSVRDAGAMTSRLPRARSVESRDVCLQICLHSAAEPGCLTAAIPSHLPL